VKVEEERGGRNGTNVRLLLVFGSPYTCHLCLTDPAWNNSPGGLRKILSQGIFVLFSFFSFPHNCTRMYRVHTHVIYND